MAAVPGPSLARALVWVAAVLAVSCAQLPVERAAAVPARPPASASPELPAPAALPPAESWIAHLTRDLAPFWTRPEALGREPGAFPTFRCADGRAWDPESPCPDLAEGPGWIRSELGREYTRMRSRQTYFYGVAYHLTGDESMLRHAREGSDWIRAHALDPATGSAVSWFEAGRPAGPPVLERTSQDLAYAALGPAFLYYLTRDEAVLADVVRLKDHIFAAYDDPAFGMLRWVARDEAGDEEERRELVATLDQVNAYMLLLAPILPEPHASDWKADLGRLCRVMIHRFWSPEHGMFRGTLHEVGFHGTRHTDFGHTIKALWMIERTGALLGDEALVRWARERAPAVLARAFRADAGCWASSVNPDGSLDRGLTWWAFAELDQMAGTLALVDRRATGWLARTTACWDQRLVDHEHGEVFGFAHPDEPARRGAKANHWKNGYHSAEHALVMYLVTSALEGRPAVLHFALPDGEEPPLRPYVFGGTLVSTERSALPGDGGRRRVRAVFGDLH